MHLYKSGSFFPVSKHALMRLSVQYILYRTLKLVNIPKPVRYEIYTLAFPFDLRCQSGILLHTVYTYAAFIASYKLEV